ncbi:MAG: gluconate 2-dehydrogenase subunit 3 family protein [Acidimicrobiales bacterium]
MAAPQYGDEGPRDPVFRRDLTQAHHLPKCRPDGKAPHPSWLPRQRRGVTPQMIGRYPDFDCFDARDTWDEATAKVIDERMAIRSGDRLRFFAPGEAATLRAFCDTCTAQYCDPRVPVAELVDDKLAGGRLDGYEYADMPDDRETWHLVLAGLDESASSRGRPDFAACDWPTREAIIEELARGRLSGGSWDRLNVPRAWSVCMRMVLAAFYSHPWAWNEIGFGGPAYPRGFMRLGPISTREPFEKPGATAEDPVRAAKELGD